MVLKIIEAKGAKVGTNIIMDGEFFTVKKIDISKTGKHGHSKARIEAQNMIKGNKKVVVVPGHDKFDVPEVKKQKAQVLSVGSDSISIMDLETFETIEIACDEEIKDTLEENDNVEYWDIEGTEKIVKRKL